MTGTKERWVISLISMEQISGEISALEEEKPTHVVMQKLAALYTVRDHMIIEAQPTSPAVVVSETIPDMGIGNEFTDLIQGRDTKEIISIMSELMDALQVANPRLYSSVMRKIDGE